MTRLLSFIWRKLAGIHLTVILCLLLAADLAAGYFCLDRRETVFAPLNEIGLKDWALTYGSHNLSVTAWFFILLGLLTILCINTFVCTTDHVVRLLRRREHFTPKRLFFKLAPHVMHYAIIVILSGYLGSYLFARVLDMRTLAPGGSMTLPDSTARITLESFDPEYYEGERLGFFQNRVILPKARLSLDDGHRKRSAVLTVNRPVRFKGYGIFLKNFSPKVKRQEMIRRPRIDLTIRRDPGVRLSLFGIVLFTAGLAMYLAEWIFFKRGKQ